MKTTVALVDDKPQNRISLAEKMKWSDDVEVLFTAENGSDFLDQMKHLAPAERPKIVLMDVEMPVMNGIEAVCLSTQLYPEVKFLMLTVFDDDDKIFEAIKAGASGYLLKDEKITTIIECIQEVVEIGGAPMSPRIARKAFDLLRNASFEGRKQQPVSFSAQQMLSERESEVLSLLVDGYNYRTIAEKLFLSTHTVRKHIANIYEKLHVTSKAQAIKIVTNNRLI
jgi:DNA-binding NarL/FixJ family response regulator